VLVTGQAKTLGVTRMHHACITIPHPAHACVSDGYIIHVGCGFFVSIQLGMLACFLRRILSGCSTQIVSRKCISLTS
jgi:hypothetical protein